MSLVCVFLDVSCRSLDVGGHVSHSDLTIKSQVRVGRCLKEEDIKSLKIENPS